jgi:hypothetical protein
MIAETKFTVDDFSKHIRAISDDQYRRTIGEFPFRRNLEAYYQPHMANDSCRRNDGQRRALVLA